MPSFGTAFIGFWGYGIALLMSLAAIACVRDGVRAEMRRDIITRDREIRLFWRCVLMAIFFAVVTRWLIG